MDNSKYSDLELNDSKVMGAKMGVETMLYYYMAALSGKVKDIKQYMANRLPAMIDLTEEQSTYVAASMTDCNTVLTSLDTSMRLLQNTIDSDNFDKDSIQLVIKILQNLYDECESALRTYLSGGTQKEEDK